MGEACAKERAIHMAQMLINWFSDHDGNCAEGAGEAPQRGFVPGFHLPTLTLDR